MTWLTRLLHWLVVLPLLCLAGAGCGKDENAVTKEEVNAVKSSVEMNSDHGLAGTTKYIRYEGGWFDDGKGGKMRVVRCVLTQGPAAQTFDLLYKIEKGHAVDQAENKAGENWRTGSIAWQSQKPKEEP